MNGPDHHSVGLTPEGLAAAFPFHFGFDAELRLTQWGPALGKLIPTLAVGQALGDYFRIVTPNVPLNLADIHQQSFTVFFLETLDKRFRLKGMMHTPVGHEGRLMLFLGSPVIREMSSISGLGLNIKDFAIHDSAVDFLILLQTKTNTINDVKNMAERLKKEVAERREAQKDLQRANEVLEERVKERTLELEAANADLQTEIGERRRAEERVRDANAQLKALVRRLEEHNRQMVLLNAMGDMLQSCKSVEETHAVIADTLAKLFPGESGVLAMAGMADGRYHQVARWGEPTDTRHEVFSAQDCWALRRGRMHEHDCGTSEAVCAHVRGHDKKDGCRYVCIPLSTHGEIHGLLHLHGVPKNADADSASDDNDRRQLLHSASEHISLAIANLKMQEYLRQQSIRDMLTGLFNRRYMEESLAHEIARAKRSGRPCGVIMLDVDHFKRFNDNYGHQAGDALLRGLGQFLQQQVRGEDVACRYGGEEFILILPGASAEDAAMRAEAIRAGIESSFRVPYEKKFLPQVTISLGVAAYPTHAQTGDDAVKAADVALYRSKQEGRNRVSVSDGALQKTA